MQQKYWEAGISQLEASTGMPPEVGFLTRNVRELSLTDPRWRPGTWTVSKSCISELIFTFLLTSTAGNVKKTSVRASEESEVSLEHQVFQHLQDRRVCASLPFLRNTMSCVIQSVKRDTPKLRPLTLIPFCFYVSFMLLFNVVVQFLKKGTSQRGNIQEVVFFLSDFPS